MGKMTTQQLAQYLNMSRSTVSKALNGHSDVAKATKETVMKAAYQFGYLEYPEETESAYLHSVHPAVCLLITKDVVENRFWNVAMDGLEEYLLKYGYYIKKLVLDDEESLIKGPLQIPAEAEGIITIGRYSRAGYKILAGCGRALVSIDSSADTRGNNLLCDVVMMTNTSCTYELTSQLLRAGRKNITFVGDKESCLSVKERWQGYVQAMQEYRSAVPPFNPLLGIPLRGDSKATIQQVLTEQTAFPDAFVCANDALAMDVLMVLQRMNRRVPEDAMLTGFDNFDSAPIVRRYSADLTSVTFDIREIGRQAARQMLYRMEYPQAPFGVYRIESKVIYRQSTDARYIR